MSWFRCIPSLLASLAVALPAGANGRFPSADLIVFEPSNPERLVVRTTFGLLESRDAGASFDWICEDVLELEDQEDPMLALTADGSLVAATVDGVAVGSRDECGFRRIAELEGEVVPDLALDRGDPRRVFAFSARGLPGSGFESQLYLSEDEGESFEPLGAPLERELLPLTVDPAPSDGERVYLTARLPREADYASVLLRSSDGGETFERFPIEGTTNLALAFLAGVHPDDPERVYVRIADPGGTVLVTSADGGETFSVVHRASGTLLGFAISPDASTLAFGGPVDGVWVAPVDGGEPEQRSELGVSCLGWSEHGLYACSDASGAFAVGRSSDEGRSFQPLVRFDELCGNLRCAAGSQVGERCASAWRALAPRLGATCDAAPLPGSGGAPAATGGAPGVPGPPSGSDGGCQVAPRSRGSLFALALGACALALAGRRRLVLSVLGVWLAGCSDDPAAVEPYTGPPAYPNQRAAYPRDGRSFGYVSNSLSDTVSVLDLDAFEVLAEVPVGRDPVGIDGPHHLAIDRDRGLFYVALSYPEDAAEQGPHAGHGTSEQLGYVERLSLDDLRPLGEARVDPSPGDIVLSPSGERVLVTHYDLVRALAPAFTEDRRASLVWFEPAEQLGTPAARETKVVVCVAPHSVVVSPDERRAFVACTGEDAIGIVDLEARAVLARAPVADSVGRPGVPLHEPYALLTDAAVEHLYVSNLRSQTVSRFSASDSPERFWTTPVMGVPYFAAWLDPERLLVAVQAPSGAVVLDAESGELLDELGFTDDECPRPHEPVVTRSGRVFMVCEGNRVERGALVELEHDSLAVRRRLELGVYPDRLVVLEP